MSKILVILAISVSMLACKSKKVETKTEYSVVFGSGGGITGAYQYYKISESSKVFKIEKDTVETKIVLTEVDRVEIDDFINRILEKDIVQDEPGNMNKEIRIYADGKLLKLYVWQVNSEHVDVLLNQFYNKLASICM